MWHVWVVPSLPSRRLSEADLPSTIAAGRHRLTHTSVLPPSNPFLSHYILKLLPNISSNQTLTH